MAITLTPETEARLREKAQQERSTPNAVAEALINAALQWEDQERTQTIAGVQRGEQAADEGRERPLTEFLTEQRVKHGFAATWPHEADDEEQP